ncbi:MAG: hypothetical protein FWG65_00220 [Turicibacter sp.]|nr:hypothetical protein [Turicibacter sp.]
MNVEKRPKLIFLEDEFDLEKDRPKVRYSYKAQTMRAAIILIMRIVVFLVSAFVALWLYGTLADLISGGQQTSILPFMQSEIFFLYGFA